MGGKPCLNEEERLARKRANSLKYYHKKKRIRRLSKRIESIIELQVEIIIKKINLNVRQ